MIYSRYTPRPSWVRKNCIVLISALVFFSAQAVGSPEIVRFWLVDAETDTRIVELEKHQTLTLPFLPTELSIEAEANDETQSVEMKIEGVHSSTENYSPYALKGDNNGDFVPVPELRIPGWLTISAQPFSADDTGGEVGSEAVLPLYLHEPDFLVRNPRDEGDYEPGDDYCSITAPRVGIDNLAVANATPDALPEDELRADTPLPANARTEEKMIGKSTPEQSGSRVSTDTVAPVLLNEPAKPNGHDGPDGLADPSTTHGCTLRAAIEEANALPGNQSILIDGTRGPFKLTKGQLTITEGVTVRGHEMPLIDAEKKSRVFHVDGGGDNIIVNLQQLDIARGKVSPDGGRGGAIRIENNALVQMSDSIVRESQANFGGGIYLQKGGDLTMWRSAVRDNIAGTPEDGIGGGGITQRGGGIYNLAGIVTIRDSSIFDNMAVRGGGLGNSGGTMRVENSSIIGNEALEQGGGIENRDVTIVPANTFHEGTLHLVFSTISNNQAGTSLVPEPHFRIGGGLLNHPGGRVFMASSILADNTDGWNAGDEHHSPDCHSPDIYDFKSYRNNVVGVLNDNCSLTDYSWGNTAWIDFGSETAPLDPGLLSRSLWGHLAYHNLSVSSIALDNGGSSSESAIYPCEDHDMRSRPRPVGAGCDIGAVERQ